MKQTVRRFLRGLAILTCAATPALADVPYARDLEKDAAAARAIDGVVLLAFVGSHCSYCETVLNDFLVPMSGNADYQAKVVMRKIESSGFRHLKDFRGRATTHGDFASRHGAHFTPTILVLDARGRVLAKPVVGFTTPDYYGVFLDEAIDTGLAKVRAPRTSE